MNKILTYLLLLFSSSLFAQNLQIESGGWYVFGNTVVNLHETSLLNDGEFKANDGTTLVLKSLSEMLDIGGVQAVNLHHMKLDADCSLSTLLQLSGDINLQSGILDLNDSNLSLGGYILNEREESRITSSGSGEIVKTISMFSGQAIHPGNMGLDVTAGDDYFDIELRRGHQSYFNGMEESIHRYYRFGMTAVELEKISISYFDAELGGADESKLDVWVEYVNSWEQLASSSRDQSLNSIAANVYKSIDRITLFPVEEMALMVPTGFSPNGDGVNDYFIIGGIENYPNNKLIVFNRWSDVVYEKASYANNWSGKSQKTFIKTSDKILVNGTYFYIFYKDEKDKHPIKGFVEIRSGKTH